MTITDFVADFLNLSVANAIRFMTRDVHLADTFKAQIHKLGSITNFETTMDFFLYSMCNRYPMAQKKKYSSSIQPTEDIEIKGMKILSTKYITVTKEVYLFVKGKQKLQIQQSKYARTKQKNIYEAFSGIHNI